MEKVKRLLSNIKYTVTTPSADSKTSTDAEQDKTIKISDNEDNSVVKRRRTSDETWLQVNEWILTNEDYSTLSGGLELNDKHVNAAQSLLKSRDSVIP